jgi:uncharacterized FlaG/YvyC family protein
MKTKEDIEKQIKGINWFINSHKKQIDFYLNDDFNPKKIAEYANKIASLVAGLEVLLWVQNNEND